MKDQKKIAEAFLAYYEDLFGLSYYYVKHQQDAQDVVMDVFEAYVKAKSTKNYTLKNEFSWLKTVCKNKAIERIRHRIKTRNMVDEKKNVKNNVENEDFFYLIGERDDEILDLMLEGLTSLRNEQRLVLEAFYFENLSYKEVGIKLSMTYNEVKSHIQNGKRNLKHYIETNRNE